MVSKIVIGRTASGKSLFLKQLRKLGFKIMESYTTRPRRYPEEKGGIIMGLFQSQPLCTDLNSVIIKAFKKKSNTYNQAIKNKSSDYIGI